MESQPPPAGRPPWFRLASIARQEAPPQPPPPPSRPPIFSALRSRADQPTAQPTPTPPPPPPPPSISPQLPAAPSTGNGIAVTGEQQASRPSTAPSRPATPQSPKIIKTSSQTPPLSPKAYHPLPAAPNPEPEPKIIPTTPNQTGSIAAKGDSEKNGSKDAANGFGNLQRDEPAVEDKRTASETKKEDARAPPPSSLHPTRRHDDNKMRIITLAGKNVGAYMELGPSLARKVEASASGSHGGKAVGENSASKSPKPLTTTVNSNVQSINNSWLINSSCNLRSPGVHVKLVSRRKSKNGRPADPVKENPK
ncbi:formin-like protein 7 [Ananas comosus]|uniref:Formin-like protein 7 n=1 Tax=Ananas comosus TaxID=4615 RepID=A0A6P5GKW9_ANACO|nr:formin-like protein 7 [Ananas comosus]